jgi:hypothetical protein
LKHEDNKVIKIKFTNNIENKTMKKNTKLNNSNMNELNTNEISIKLLMLSLRDSLSGYKRTREKEHAEGIIDAFDSSIYKNRMMVVKKLLNYIEILKDTKFHVPADIIANELVKQDVECPKLSSKSKSRLQKIINRTVSKLKAIPEVDSLKTKLDEKEKKNSDSEVDSLKAKLDKKEKEISNLKSENLKLMEKFENYKNEKEIEISDLRNGNAELRIDFEIYKKQNDQTLNDLIKMFKKSEEMQNDTNYKKESGELSIENLNQNSIYSEKNKKINKENEDISDKSDENRNFLDNNTSN